MDKENGAYEAYSLRITNIHPMGKSILQLVTQNLPTTVKSTTRQPHKCSYLNESHVSVGITAHARLLIAEHILSATTAHAAGAMLDSRLGVG